jgi:hypothetical protein
VVIQQTVEDMQGFACRRRDHFGAERLIADFRSWQLTGSSLTPRALARSRPGGDGQSERGQHGFFPMRRLRYVDRRRR